MKGIASKLVLIMDECRYAQKDGRNAFHNYRYVSAANILEKVNDACVSHRVASVPSYSIVSTEQKDTAKGGKEYLVTVQCELTIIDADSGEAVTARSLGTGQDAGDKAVAKGQTMALKYAWMSTLNISTGDDPEADQSVDERNAGRPPEQKAVAQTPQVLPAQRQPQQTVPQSTPQPQAQPQQTNSVPADNGRKAISDNQMKAIQATAKRKGVDYHSYLGEYGCTSCTELSFQQASDLIGKLNQLANGSGS